MSILANKNFTPYLTIAALHLKFCKSIKPFIKLYSQIKCEIIIGFRHSISTKQRIQPLKFKMLKCFSILNIKNS